MELDYEIQSKIASAALKLATEVTARKSVRKLRKISYQQATTKVKFSCKNITLYFILFWKTCTY